MIKKIDEHTTKRIRQLLEIGLTQEVIATRLGISARTVRVYARSFRTGMKPYQTEADQHADEAFKALMEYQPEPDEPTGALI